MESCDIVVRDGPLRCPYCHEGIEIAVEEWTACSGCLARHHAACWTELGACAACRGAGALAREFVPGRHVRPTRRQRARRRRQLLVAAIVASVIVNVVLALTIAYFLGARLGMYAGTNYGGFDIDR